MFKRRCVKQEEELEAKLASEAKRSREETELLAVGAAREALIRKARQAETGSHMSEWMQSPALQLPTK
jgi:hypothetical protein